MTLMLQSVEFSKFTTAVQLLLWDKLLDKILILTTIHEIKHNFDNG